MVFKLFSGGGVFPPGVGRSPTYEMRRLCLQICKPQYFVGGAQRYPSLHVNKNWVSLLTTHPVFACSRMSNPESDKIWRLVIQDFSGYGYDKFAFPAVAGRAWLVLVRQSARP